MSQYIAHHARMNKRQAVTRYVARHSTSQAGQDDGRYVGRHVLADQSQRLGARRGGVLGRFLFLLLFLNAAISTLTGSTGRDRRASRYATSEQSACETTVRLRPIYK